MNGYTVFIASKLGYQDMVYVVHKSVSISDFMKLSYRCLLAERDSVYSPIFPIITDDSVIQYSLN